MPVLTDKDIGDLVTSTLDDLGRLKFSDAASTLQNYPFFSSILKKDRVSFESGTGVQRTIMVQHNNAAKNVGMFQTKTTNVADSLKTILVPWRHTTTGYAFERREMLMNRGAAMIVKLLKVRRSDALLSLAELIESDGWNKPADDTDKVQPFGVPYWVVQNNMTGFTGSLASGFTSGPGGLNSDTYTRTKNYSFQYTNINKTDMLSKLRTGHRKIRFKSPIDVNDYRKGAGERYRGYTNETVLKGMEDLAEGQNDNLGRDLGVMDGVTTFRRNPLFYVAELDDNNVKTDPIYLLDMNQFYPVILSGDYLYEHAPQKVAGQSNTFVIDIDLTWNMVCAHRRGQLVGSK